MLIMQFIYMKKLIAHQVMGNQQAGIGIQLLKTMGNGEIKMDFIEVILEIFKLTHLVKENLLFQQIYGVLAVKMIKRI